jgi:tetratricopeptide (TPR) repeat protein
MYTKAYIVLADCYYKMNKDSEALDILRNCLQTKSDVLKSIEKKEIKILMGTIYMNMKQYKPAIDCFREVLSQRPINETVKVKLAICL